METKKRTLAEIQQNYTELCAKAGHLHYSIYALTQDLELVDLTLKDLNIEGATVQKAEAEAKATVAAPVEPITSGAV